MMALPYNLRGYLTQAVEDISHFTTQEWKVVGRNALIGAAGSGLVGGAISSAQGDGFGSGFSRGAILGGLGGGIGTIGVGVIGGNSGIGARRAGHFGINPYGLESGPSAVRQAAMSRLSGLISR